MREKRSVEQCYSPCEDRALADLLRCCAWLVDAGLASKALSHQRRRRDYVYPWDRFSVSFLKALDSSDFYNVADGLDFPAASSCRGEAWRVCRGTSYGHGPWVASVKRKVEVF